MFHFLFFFYCYTSVSFDLGHIYNKSEGQKVTLKQKIIRESLQSSSRFLRAISCPDFNFNLTQKEYFLL